MSPKQGPCVEPGLLLLREQCDGRATACESELGKDSWSTAGRCLGPGGGVSPEMYPKQVQGEKLSGCCAEEAYSCPQGTGCNGQTLKVSSSCMASTLYPRSKVYIRMYLKGKKTVHKRLEECLHIIRPMHIQGLVGSSGKYESSTSSPCPQVGHGASGPS